MNSPGAATPGPPPELLDEPDVEVDLPAAETPLSFSVSWRVVLLVVALLALSLVAGLGGSQVLSILAQSGP